MSEIDPTVDDINERLEPEDVERARKLEEQATAAVELTGDEPGGPAPSED